MEKATRRSPAELSGGEKGYHDRDGERTSDVAKEDQPEPTSCDDSVEPDPESGHNKPVASPTDCVLKIKTSGPDNSSHLPLRDCSQDEIDSPASSRTPLSPPYRHILPEPHSQQSLSHRAPEPQYYQPAPPWHHHPQPHEDAHHYPGGEQEPHTNVRLPSIAALLTEPYTPQPMPRMAGYNDRVDWAQPPVPAPAPDRYPPMVAALPLDDSRARTPQPMPQRKRGRLPKETTDFLKAWLHSHSAHPYPSEIEKKQMCHATGLSMSQVSNWMINGRRRILGPSYLSTSRSSNPHGSPPVTLSSPPVTLSSPSVMLSAPSLMLRSPPGSHSS